MSDLKLIVLVISSDDLEVYRDHERLWRSYMHLDDRVHARFLRSNPNNSASCVEDGDVLWCRNENSYVPGILDKTLTGLRHILTQDPSFDFVLRTNLSSFFVWDRLLKRLEDLPEHRCYAGFTNFYDGSPRGGPEIPSKGSCYVSGAGIVLSHDAVVDVVEHQNKLTVTHDDIALGRLFDTLDYTIRPLPRADIASLAEWRHKTLPDGAFHFRLKHHDASRRGEEALVHRDLVRMFYPEAVV